MKPKLIISGSIAIDRIMNFQGKFKNIIRPEKVHVLSVSVLLKKLKNTQGGVAANIAYTLALLGEKPILLVSAGCDAVPYINKLSKLGIDTSQIYYSKLPTASFNVITDQDDNQIGGFYPGAMSDNKNTSFKKWQNENALFVVSPNDPKTMNKLVQECKKNKLKMFYDFGQQVSNSPAEYLLEGIKTAEIVIANDYEMSFLCEKIKYTPKRLKSSVPICITTLGENGCLIEGKTVKKPIKIAPAKPKTVLDPTGAGDAFRSGFLFGYVNGFDLKTCGQIGATSAVYAVETYGTQEHFFTFKEFSKRYQENFNEKLKI